MKKILTLLMIAAIVLASQGEIKMEAAQDYRVSTKRDGNGQVDYKRYYNEDGKVVRYDDWNKGYRVKIVKYDGYGKVDSITYYKEGVKSRFEDWNNGYKVRVVYYSPNGRVNYKYFYTDKGVKRYYEDWNNGQKLLGVAYNADGKVRTRTTFVNGRRYKVQNNFPARGRRVVTYYSNGRIDSRYYYGYFKAEYRSSTWDRYEDWNEGKVVAGTYYMPGATKPHATFKGSAPKQRDWSNYTTTRIKANDGRIGYKPKEYNQAFGVTCVWSANYCGSFETSSVEYK